MPTSGEPLALTVRFDQVSELLKVSFLGGSSGTHFVGLTVLVKEKTVGAAVSQLLVRGDEFQKDL